MTYNELIKIAYANINNSYSPYSKYRVSALIVTNNGEIYQGVNIENASFGSTICAERVAIYNAYANGVKKDEIKTLLILNEANEFPYPCGNCLQVLNELFPSNGEIVVVNKSFDYKIVHLNELMPLPFKL